MIAAVLALAALLVTVHLVRDRRARIDQTQIWMTFAVDHGLRRLEASLRRVDHMTQLMQTDLDAARAITDPGARPDFLRATEQMARIFDQAMPTLLLAPDGAIAVDAAGSRARVLQLAIARLPSAVAAPRFILLPGEARADPGYVVRLRPVPLPDGGSGLVAVALPADVVFRNALTLSPPLNGHFRLVAESGLSIASDETGEAAEKPPASPPGPAADLLAAPDDTLEQTRPVGDGSLRAVATISLAPVLAAWRLHVLWVLAIALLGLALVLAFLILAARRSRRRLAEEQAYTRQLEHHAEAVSHLAAATDVDTLLRIATEWIRIIIPAHQSIASVTRNADFAQSVHAISFSERYAGWRTYDTPSDGSGIYRLVCRDNRPMRLTQAELVSHPAWRGFGTEKARHPPMRGWLAAPLIGRDGSSLGLLQLTDRDSGDFTETDESLLVQIAQIVSARLEALDARAAGEEARTAQAQARAEAESARAELARILSSISDGVCVVGRDWRVRYTNPGASAMVSGRLDRNRSLWEAAPELAAERVRTRLETAMTEGRPVTAGLTNPGDGRVLDIRAFPFEDGLTVVLTDRTRQSEIEAQLRQTQKMEALGQLTGGVAHDFNNLLTVILGNGDIIVETVGDNRIAATAARLLLTAAERASALTDRLLSFARRRPLEPRPVDVGALVDDTRDLLARTLGERIEVRVSREAPPWQAMADPGQLETALLNLALNARDAMPDGGVLTIETRNVHVDADFIETHPGVEPGRYVRLSVSDTGSGMDRAARARAFEPFFTTKEPGHGSGLGLAMVYGFVHQSGGHADIQSTPGKGTTVRLYLPAERSGDAALPPAAGGSPVPTGTESILLVEDDELVREHVAATLLGLGYRVHAVGSGAEAEAVAGQGTGFALLLTDVVLPGPLNGRVLAERLRNRMAGLRILFMSGYAEDDILMRDGAEALGAALLQKPFRRQDIAVRVRAALDSGSASAPSRASPPKSL